MVGGSLAGLGGWLCSRGKAEIQSAADAHAASHRHARWMVDSRQQRLNQESKQR
jgi:hypothetical protein